MTKSKAPSAYFEALAKKQGAIPIAIGIGSPVRRAGKYKNDQRAILAGFLTAKPKIMTK